MYLTCDYNVYIYNYKYHWQHCRFAKQNFYKISTQVEILFLLLTLLGVRSLGFRQGPSGWLLYLDQSILK
jgi:hypothetical protein